MRKRMPMSSKSIERRSTFMEDMSNKIKFIMEDMFFVYFSNNARINNSMLS